MRTDSDLPILELLLTVFNSILEVFIVCVAGYVLAGQGILNKRMQNQLNRLNITLFTPCLLLSKVALSLSPSKLRELWVVPIFWVIITFLSMASAYTLGSLFKLKTMHRNFAMAAAMFMNSNSLPVALMRPLVISVKGLKWGDDDTGDAMLGRALSYLVIAYGLGMVLRWSFGVRLLSVPAGKEPSTITSRGETLLIELDGVDDEDGGGDIPLPIPQTRLSFHHSPQNKGLVHRFWTTTKPLMQKASVAARGIINPPLFAAIVSIFIALIPSLQEILAHDLQPAKRALSGAGNCSIPCTLLVLGAYFYESPEDSHPFRGDDSEIVTPRTPDPDQTSTASRSVETFLTTVQHTVPLRRLQSSLENIPRWMRDQQQGIKAERPDETKAVAIAILSRMLIAPFLLMPIIIWCARGSWQAVFEDPVFVVTNILLVSSPSAVTLAQLTSAASGDTFERLISRTIFWSYCIVTPPATIFYLVVGLSLARI